MIISDLHNLDACQTNSIVGAGDSLGYVSPVAISTAGTGAGRNNIGSPSIGIALNLAPVLQIPVF